MPAVLVDRGQEARGGAEKVGESAAGERRGRAGGGEDGGERFGSVVYGGR